MLFPSSSNSLQLTVSQVTILSGETVFSTIRHNVLNGKESLTLSPNVALRLTSYFILAIENVRVSFLSHPASEVCLYWL